MFAIKMSVSSCVSIPLSGIKHTEQPKNEEETQNYILVDNDVALKKSLQELQTNRSAHLAVDCEGVSLSRDGELTIVTVATEEKAYIFDIVALKQTAFDQGLRTILEDSARKKLMFDCREDSDALSHQFRVKLSGVLDVQLLEVLYRRQHDESPSKSTRGKRRSMRVDEVENIYGLRRCIELYINDEDALKAKDDGKELIELVRKLWKKRPLSDILLRYCAVDTLQLFKLYNKLKSDNEQEFQRLKVASDRYVDMFRCKTERCFDDFEKNAYLPLDIIPEKGTLSFPRATTQCTECDRLFPHEEFSRIQLQNGVQKCRVCKEVKRRIDVAVNRADNWHRVENDRFEYQMGIEWQFDEYDGGYSDYF